MPDISVLHFRYPRSVVLQHRYSVVVIGNALVLTHDGTQDMAYLAAQTPAADGDTFSQSVYLAAGAYTLDVLGRTNLDCGIVDWYFDGVLVAAGQDWYSAGPVVNVVKTAAVTVTSDGQHTLVGVINGRNGASIGYVLALSTIAMR